MVVNQVVLTGLIEVLEYFVLRILLLLKIDFLRYNSNRCIRSCPLNKILYFHNFFIKSVYRSVNRLSLNYSEGESIIH